MILVEKESFITLPIEHTYFFMDDKDREILVWLVHFR